METNVGEMVQRAKELALVAWLALSVAGCAKVLPSGEVARQFKACRDVGGEPIATTVSNYNSAVKWVACHKPKAREALMGGRDGWTQSPEGWDITEGAKLAPEDVDALADRM